MITLHSPAKINLGLKITGRRASDGYHLLESVFVPISFGDDIIVEETDAAPSNPGFRITTENLLNGPNRDDFEKVSERGDISKNLVYRAMERILLLEEKESGTERQKTRPGNFHIHIKKRIPTGGGLGGGSSNAGTILGFMQNRLGCSLEPVQKIALTLGADVPFFLKGKPAAVSGIGDIMEAISIGPGQGILCLPDFSSSTEEAYDALNYPLQPGPDAKNVFLLTGDIRQALAGSVWFRVRGLKNDFEEVLFRKYPVLETVKSAFYRFGAAYSSMTGSGSALFALLEGRGELETLCEKMRREFPRFYFLTFFF